MNPDIFRAYDVRGVFGEDFEAGDFYAIGQAYAKVFAPRQVALGHDVRASSPELWHQTAEGLTDAGVDVLNIGPISTDMLYFAVVNHRTDGGMVISASHNPAEYNGVKMVREKAIPISGDSGIFDVRDEALRLLKSGPTKAKEHGVVRSVDLMNDYLMHLRTFIDVRKLGDKRLVLNANCGFAGLVADRLLLDTRVDVRERVFFQPDGTFADVPNGRPDPLRPENRSVTVEAIRRAEVDFATAWDADADRCFFFDEHGGFVDGCYITARLAEMLLRRHGGGGVVYDPRLIWAVEDRVQAAGGTPLLNKCGHSFIKERMRKDDALFGGESSAHYYFRRNFYTDNGMIPFLLVLEHLCESGKTMSGWVNELRERFPVSGEVNFKFEDMALVPKAVERVLDAPADWGDAEREPEIDGLSLRFLKDGDPVWRLNLRKSNTEPVLRLNVEAMDDVDLMQAQTELIGETLTDAGGTRDTPYAWEG